MKRNEGGFTLLEVILAVAIVAMLAAAVAPLLFAQVGEQRVEGTLNDMEALADGIRRFYRDTGKMPPVLEALVSLNVPYDDDFDGVIDEDGLDSVDNDGDGNTDEDPPGINPVNYENRWKGPYIQGGATASTNPAFSDAWGTNYGYCFVETGLDVNNNSITDLICAGPTMNPDGSRQMDAWDISNGFLMCPRQSVRAVIVSFGKDHGVNVLPVDYFNTLLHPNGSAYDAFNMMTMPSAYDTSGLLRMTFNDDDDINGDNIPDGDCISAEAAGIGGVDEDEYGDANGDGNPDDDGDGRTDEDPSYGVASHPGDLFRFVAIEDLVQDKAALTTQRLDALEKVIKQFYLDTNRMPPALTALISLNVTGVNPVDYPGWNGPYMSGTPDFTNPDFLDGWGNMITMLVWVDRGTYGFLPHPFTFTDVSRNDLIHPLGKYQAAVISRGTDLEFTFDGSGTFNPGVEVDNDGDGNMGEDDADGLDNDADGLIDEDPPAAYEGQLNLSGTTDQNAPDPFRLISIRNIISEKSARTGRMIADLNLAAQKFNNDTPAFNNDGDAAVNEDPVDTIDNDSDTFTDEDPAGYFDLDVEEGKVAGGAFNTLRNTGYIGGSYQKDAWNRLFLWDSTNDRFYSLGTDGCPGACPGGPAGTGDDVI